jgi:Putative esterase
MAFALCLAITSQASAGYEGHKYTEPGTGQVLEYNLYVPNDYDETKSYPLLVFLHAANNTNPPRRSLSSDGKGWTGSFLENGRDKKFPSFFLIPISQTNSSGWGDGRSDTEKFEGRLTIVVLKELVASGEYNIDPDRLYVTGPSMGGRGSWDMIEKNPGFFAAAAPIAAPGLDDAAKVIGENIWSINGERDSTVGDNRDTIEAIRELGGNPIYTELAGRGHDTWRAVYPTDAFMTWMYAQRRGVPWWNVSQVPELSDRLTPDQVVVSGPTEPTDPPEATGGADAGTGGPDAGTGGTDGASGGTDSGFGVTGGSNSGGTSGDPLVGTGGTTSVPGLMDPGTVDPGGSDDPSGPNGNQTGCSYAPRPSPFHTAWFLMLSLLSLFALRRNAR